MISPLPHNQISASSQSNWHARLNLRVDYVPSGEKTLVGQAIETTVFGHGVATTIKWLPTHLQLIVEALS